MTLDGLLNLIKTQPEMINFEDVIQVIDTNYTYTPSRFTNGQGKAKIVNEAGTNEGSCKIFSFAQSNKLSKDQTLACFGKFYREDVLQHPEYNNHANIRTLIEHSLDAIEFDNTVLVLHQFLF
ncbi:HopJ type III effector protein [Beggiatoa alba]|nr:HopJ type III effector protein [Beggiatoa alba]